MQENYEAKQSLYIIDHPDWKYLDKKEQMSLIEIIGDVSFTSIEEMTTEMFEILSK